MVAQGHGFGARISFPRAVRVFEQERHRLFRFGLYPAAEQVSTRAGVLNPLGDGALSRDGGALAAFMRLFFRDGDLRRGPDPLPVQERSSAGWSFFKAWILQEIVLGGGGLAASARSKYAGSATVSQRRRGR